MKSINIKSVVSVFFVSALLISGSVQAQRKSVRTQSESRQPQMSIESQQTMSEIEMMRNTIQERRRIQEQQQREMDELKLVIRGQLPESGQPTYVKHTEPSYTSSPKQHQRVTSGSVLSQIETYEREEIVELQHKYDMEIRIAQKEIEMLHQQLEIANRQLGDCQNTSVSVNRAVYDNNRYEPIYTAPKVPKQKSAKPQKQSRARNQRQPTQYQQVAQPEISDKNKQAMQEIEMMRNEIRERRERYEQQQRDLQILKQALD